jgi:hypothetical protein
MNGGIIDEIVAERQRLRELGLPPNDPGSRPSDLPKAAAAFALCAVRRYAKAGWPELFWPWRRPRFRPGESRENLIRAAALIVTEIERLDGLAPESCHPIPPPLPSRSDPTC